MTMDCLIDIKTQSNFGKQCSFPSVRKGTIYYSRQNIMLIEM